MRPIVVTVGPLAAAAADAICATQTPSAGALLINGTLASGGVATLDNPRRVLITASGNESSKTFTITGTGFTGGTQSETITGPNATTAQSVLDYKTVTSITISGNAAGSLTVGTNGVAGSSWVRMDDWSQNFITIQCSVSGTVNYTIQNTLDDPNSATNPVALANVTWLNTNDTDAVGASASVKSNFQFAPAYARILLNSGTGSVTATFLQSGGVIK